MKKSNNECIVILCLLVLLAFCNPSYTKNCKADFVISGTTFGCAPFALQFFDSSSSDVYSWIWAFGTGDTIINEQNFWMLFSQPGSYDVTLFIETPSGCKDTLTQKDYIKVGGAIVNDVTLIDTSVCIPYSVYFKIDVAYAKTLILDFGNGYLSYIESGTITSHKYFDGQNYRPMLSIEDSSGYCTRVIDFPIIAVPDPKVSFFADKTYSMSDSIYFTNTSYGRGADSLQWEWNFGDGTPLDTTKNPVHYYISPGNYNVSLTGILKDKYGTCYFDTTAYNYIWVEDNSTSILQIKMENDIIIYPNPNMGVFYISHKSKNYSINTIKIFNIDGELIYFDSFKGDINNSNKQISILEHKKGIYNIQLITNSNLINKRVIIE